MEKIVACIILFFLGMTATGQPIFSVSHGEVSFFSKAPVEDIDAHNLQPGSVINAAEGSISVVIPVRNFIFKKSLMQEHFNEKYMESDKFPMASFKGKFNNAIDFTKDTLCDISATGNMTIHGVEKRITLNGRLKISGHDVSIDSEFKVALKDYHITIPKLLFENIAEEIDVKVMLSYLPYQKK